MGHERHGFNYQNEAAVVRQLDACLKTVREFKNHPAVLIWAVGNEMEGNGTNPAIWYAVDHVAREIKRIDPDHPTMTVIAELGEHKVESIERFCPHIDIIGVNSYGGIQTLPQRYRAAGGSKPYIVTEHGPLGPWEVEKTEWGAAIEETSTQKKDRYAKGYRVAVAEQSGLCLGSYAFYWGQKQETTATWFGMFLSDGSRLAAVDAMTEAWTGASPPNRCPEIQSLTPNRAAKLRPGETWEARVAAQDPDGDPLQVEWQLRYDTMLPSMGGDAEPEEATFHDAVKSNGNRAVVTMPEGGGGYRLYVCVRDDHGGAAVGNIPLYVDAPIKPLPAPRAALPLVVYGDHATFLPYVPSGYMGNTEAIVMTPDCTDHPHSGATCLKVEYRAADKWGGVLWQSPANDWEGTRPGGWNLSDATALEFWARGEEGGEIVDFMLGVLDGNQPYRDSAKVELRRVVLASEWRKYRLELEGRDLSRIKTGFGWSLAGNGKPTTFYLDDIRYVGK